VAKAPRIVILTGSGISAESGLSTFRDASGIWAKYDYREVATPQGFAADPRLVHEFYNQRRRTVAGVEPNAAHFALARLETEIAAAGGVFTLVTQNVDNLHERAGSRNLLHMHGEMAKARCDRCEEVLAWADDLSVETACPVCGEVGGMRPHVVWFGEIPLFMPEIASAIARADHFVSIGTSGSVYPAAGFVAEARQLNIPCTELNLEPSENAWSFTQSRYGKASEIVPAWVEEFLG
jgi:NAD-dependent deacetylase